MKKVLFLIMGLISFCLTSCGNLLDDLEDASDSSITVSYSADKEYAVPESFSVEKGTILTEEQLPNPYDESFKFSGWYDQNDQFVTAGEYAVNSKTVLTAKWTYPDEFKAVAQSGDEYIYRYICKDIPMTYTITFTCKKFSHSETKKSGESSTLSYKFDDINSSYAAKGATWTATVTAVNTELGLTYKNSSTAKITKAGQLNITLPSTVIKQ